ncbi:hypothetical protein [Nakamurella sp.]|uniref:hypothetical protein n=1 Tax=Nakamurella sp. TaxID=1869182 RepID=UPI0037852EA1
MALRKLHRQVGEHECYGQAGANVDGWIDWMAGGLAPEHDCPGGAYVITGGEA